MTGAVQRCHPTVSWFCFNNMLRETCLWGSGVEYPMNAGQSASPAVRRFAVFVVPFHLYCHRISPRLIALFLLFVALFSWDIRLAHAETFPFSDTAYRADIDPNTVITKPTHGMWVVTAGSYHSPSASESVYVYEERGGEIMLSDLRSNIYRDGDVGPRCNSIDSDTTQRTDRRDSCGSR